jgi:hypothetical protein
MPISSCTNVPPCAGVRSQWANIPVNWQRIRISRRSSRRSSRKLLSPVPVGSRVTCTYSSPSSNRSPPPAATTRGSDPARRGSPRPPRRELRGGPAADTRTCRDSPSPTSGAASLLQERPHRQGRMRSRPPPLPCPQRRSMAQKRRRPRHRQAALCGGAAPPRRARRRGTPQSSRSADPSRTRRARISASSCQSSRRLEPQSLAIGGRDDVGPWPGPRLALASRAGEAQRHRKGAPASSTSAAGRPSWRSRSATSQTSR